MPGGAKPVSGERGGAGGAEGATGAMPANPLNPALTAAAGFGGGEMAAALRRLRRGLLRSRRRLRRHLHGLRQRRRHGHRSACQTLPHLEQRTLRPVGGMTAAVSKRVLQAGQIMSVAIVKSHQGPDLPGSCNRAPCACPNPLIPDSEFSIKTQVGPNVKRIEDDA